MVAGATDAGARGGTPDSRERLVTAAVELVLSHYESDASLRAVFDYLTPGAVAERAGLSRGLIYHYWGGSDTEGPEVVARFLTEVCDRLWALSAIPEDLADAADLLPDDFSEVVLALSSHELHRMAGPDRARMRASQALTVHGAWPAGEADNTIRRLTRLYLKLSEKLRREPVPPLDLEDVALAISAVFEGYSLLYNVYPDRILAEYDWHGSTSTESAGPWTLAAITAEGVLMNMTRPIETGT